MSRELFRRIRAAGLDPTFAQAAAWMPYLVRLVPGGKA